MNSSSYMALNAFNFGYDVGTFSGVQGMQTFQDDFGVYNSKTKQWELQADRKSTRLNSSHSGESRMPSSA